MKFSDKVPVQIVSADPVHTLRIINRTVAIYDVSIDDDAMTCRFSVQESHLAEAERIARSRGDDFQIINRNTFSVALSRMLKRPVLLLGLAAVFALTLFLPSRVLFFTVEGNRELSAETVLSAASQCGMNFGISRKDLRSEKMKNALLQALPQLQWAGINTSGCVATITVRERQLTAPQLPQSAVSSIVATRDGVIREITVEKGNGVCQVGQVVKAGQVLISGYTDCGLSVRATRAQGEVYAATLRQLTVICPTEQQQRGQAEGKVSKISFILGKKRINFYKGSGISDSSCVKMYSESYLTLPGGFQLPVGIVTETWTQYESADSVCATNDSGMLEDFARHYLQEQMVAGQILSAEQIQETDDALVSLHGKYACLEMIGAVRNEEILKDHGN